MLEELKTARLDGKSYNDIQGDIVKLVNYFTNLWYKDYPVIRQHGCEKEDIVSAVYRGLFLRTRDDGLSNLERHFIKASKIENCTMSYMSNLIRKSVKLTLMCVSRDIVKKPICESLDKTIYSDGDKDIVLSDTLKDCSTSFEDEIELKLTLESIKHKKYKEYYRINSFDEKIKLSTKDVLDWLVAGYKITDMCTKVYCRDGSNIDYKTMSKIKRETIELARKAFYED